MDAAVMENLELFTESISGNVITGVRAGARFDISLYRQ